MQPAKSLRRTVGPAKLVGGAPFSRAEQDNLDNENKLYLFTRIIYFSSPLGYLYKVCVEAVHLGTFSRRGTSSQRKVFMRCLLRSLSASFKGKSCHENPYAQTGLGSKDLTLDLADWENSSTPHTGQGLDRKVWNT